MQNGTELKMAFLHEAEQHLVLGQPSGIPVVCPVRIMHGLADQLVPHTIPLAVITELQSRNARLLLVKVGLLHCIIGRS